MRWKRQRTTNTATLDPAGSEERRLAKVAYLAETDLFRGMNNLELKQIERSTAMTTCTRGTVFYTPGETGEALFILKQGRVNLYRTTPDGRKLVTSTVERGTVFGEMSVIGQGMQESFAEAAEDCTLCVMSRTDVERLLRERPETALHLIEILTRRLTEAEAWLAEVAYKSVPSRIATTLLRLSGEERQPVRLSHQDIADIVGTYRETATRILNELRAEGAIALERMHIEIRDRERLEELADEGA
jgi:CRP-like cAMP-binding protein